MADDWYTDPELARRWAVAVRAHAAWRDAAEGSPEVADLITEAIAADSAYSELFRRLRDDWYAGEG